MSVENDSRIIANNIRRFLNKIKEKGTNYNSKTNFITLRSSVDKVVRKHIGNVTYNAIKHGITLPSNKVIENQRKANNRKRNSLQKRTRTTRRVSYGHTLPFVIGPSRVRNNK